MWNPSGCGGLVLLLVLCVLQGRALSHLRPHGTDCGEIKARSPGARSGAYVIQPRGARTSFLVYCEMLTDGGWTVFQRRTGGGVPFAQTWDAYKHGFGNPLKDHWLGLQKVWALAQDEGRPCALRVDLWDFEGGVDYAEYRDFKLGDESQAYKLSVGAYNGTAGDAIRGAYAGIDQNGYGFSAMDRDNDGCSPCLFGDILQDDCSRDEGGGGWWYSRCGSASLHGDWHPKGQNLGWGSGLHWRTWKGPAPYSARATRMMLRAAGP